MAKKKVFVHCSLSYFGSILTLDKWHTSAPHNFNEVGYHYAILNGLTHADLFNPLADGLLEVGRRIDILGAHTRGYNDGIGICLIGESGKFTLSQIETLKWTLNRLNEIYPEGIEIFRHSDKDPVNKSFCPGIEGKEWEEIKECITN